MADASPHQYKYLQDRRRPSRSCKGNEDIALHC